jgi:excisionase family DNA binding protein
MGPCQKREEKAMKKTSEKKVVVDELLDMDGAIKLLKTTRPTFYRWLRSGKLKGMKIGRQWRFEKGDIERFLKGQEPRIELPTDITPLVRTLAKQVEEITKKKPEMAGDDGVVNAVNLMILLGIHWGASDIHLTTHMKHGGEVEAVLRYRVDGVLNVATTFDARLMPAIAQRWKTLASCDIRQNIQPQDGRIMFPVNGGKKSIDIRVNFLPALLGEGVTARLLDADRVVLTLDAIDYAPRDKQKILEYLNGPWGIIVFTGPTGSGKTTAMYASLNKIAKPEDKIMSVEDPVEIYLPWVTQVPVRPNHGVTFTTTLRAILRSDPDVIMVNEIRDSESLAVTQEASLTGHLILTALHTADAPSALIRLIEICGEPFVAADSTKLIVAQRLVRKLCPDCSATDNPSPELLTEAALLAKAGGLDWNGLEKHFKKPVGCEKCRKTGYRGRTVVAEVLEVTPAIGAAMRKKASEDELRGIAVRQGMTTIAADGIRRAAAGETSLQEVFRTLGLQ